MDISCGGMLAELDSPLVKGDAVTCRFCLPGSSQELEVDGEVVRVAPGKAGFPCHGIRFVGLEEAVRASIEAYVAGT